LVQQHAARQSQLLNWPKQLMCQIVPSISKGPMAWVELFETT
jgi:hypothetical protein